MRMTRIQYWKTPLTAAKPTMAAAIHRTAERLKAPARMASTPRPKKNGTAAARTSLRSSAPKPKSDAAAVSPKIWPESPKALFHRVRPPTIL